MEKDKTFKPTVEWMDAKYDEMNHELFGGRLGRCFFGIFTTGNGAEGNVLGRFKITARNIRVNRYNRRIYKDYGYSDKLYVDSSNFFEVCEPKIELNGNYSGTEHAFLGTLVHEMCHYYTYMNGFAPKQGHGPEFREIGMIVSSRSNGLFTIQRLADAEEMAEFELDDKMKAKNDKRLNNKKSAAIAVIVYKKDGSVRLVLTKSEELIYHINNIESEKSDTVKVIRSNDAKLIETLFSSGYDGLMRKYRYWEIGNEKNLLDAIDNSEYTELYENAELANKFGGQLLSVKHPTEKEEEPPHEEPQEKPHEEPKQKRIFSIKTTNGTFEHEVTSYGDLFYAIKAKFPKMKDEVIKKIIANPANYRIVESRMNTKSIIREVIDEFMRNEFRGGNNMEDDITIDPNMNLGLKSPLEAE